MREKTKIAVDIMAKYFDVQEHFLEREASLSGAIHYYLKESDGQENLKMAQEELRMLKAEKQQLLELTERMINTLVNRKRSLIEIIFG